jgi:hypothetical protein
LATLLGEAAKADRIMRESSHVACTAA